MVSTEESDERSIGGIRLHRLIGSGGYGDVWLGTDGVDREVAVKLIDHRVARGGASQREERALRLISENLSDHPNLVRIKHIGIEHGVFFYAMELADPIDPKTKSLSPNYEPSTLQSLLAPGEPLGIDLCVGITLEILDGLEHLHRSGIVHRDLKPANILRINGKWKLADFGLATNDQTEVTTAGTIGYLAPNGPLGHSADLYAVGKILYSMLTGQGVSRFPSVGDALDRISDRQRFGRILRVVNRACHHLPEHRFESVADFRTPLVRAADRGRTARRQRAKWIACTGLVAATAFYFGYKQTQPAPLGVGSVIDHTTLPFDFPDSFSPPEFRGHFYKPGGEPMRVVITHDETWRKSDGGTGHRYLACLVSPDANQWAIDDAIAIAEHLGGYLVSLNTPEENMWVFMNLANDRKLWRSWAKPASGRFLNGEFEADPSLSLPALDEEAQNFADNWAKPEWRELARQGRPLLPCISGPVIGLIWDGREFTWSDGSPLTHTAWLPVQPYVDEETFTGFQYANDESLALTPQWSRTNGWNNYTLDEGPNRFISFIVEIPK